MKTPVNEDLLKNIINTDNSILEAAEKYKRHASVIEIKENTKIQN